MIKSDFKKYKQKDKDKKQKNGFNNTQNWVIKHL